MKIAVLFGRALVALLLVASAVTLASSLPAGAAVGTCGDFTFVNNLDEDVKVKQVLDGTEHTRHRLGPDQSVTVAIDVGELWVVRKPSNAERLWAGPESCPADGEATVVIDPGPQPGFACGAERNNGSLTFIVHSFNTPDGTRIALNLERGERPDEEFIFLGTHRRTGQTTVIEVAEPPGLSGEWLTKARLRFPDGTRTPRQNCGIIDFSLDVPPPQPLDPPACFAHDQIWDGEEVTAIGITGDFGDSVNLRSDGRWVAKLTDSELGRLDRDLPVFAPRGVDQAVVRGGSANGPIDCLSGWSGDGTVPPHDHLRGHLYYPRVHHVAGDNLLWGSTLELIDSGFQSESLYVADLSTGKSIAVDHSAFPGWAGGFQFVDRSCNGNWALVAFGNFGPEPFSGYGLVQVGGQDPGATIGIELNPLQFQFGGTLSGGFDCNTNEFVYYDPDSDQIVRIPIAD